MFLVLAMKLQSYIENEDSVWRTRACWCEVDACIEVMECKSLCDGHGQTIIKLKRRSLESNSEVKQRKERDKEREKDYLVHYYGDKCQLPLLWWQMSIM